jgi:hypothetical protein
VKTKQRAVITEKSRAAPPNDIALWRFLQALDRALEIGTEVWGYKNDGTGHAGQDATLTLMRLRHELTLGLTATDVRAWTTETRERDDLPF